MKLIALVKDLFIKAGVKMDDTKVAEFLNTGTIQDVEVPDEVANQVNTTLMSLAAAESDTNLRSKLIGIGRKEAYDGMDSEINATMNELGIADDVKQKILAEKSTTKRAALLAKEVKGSSEKGSTQKEMTETINKLNKQISDAQAEKEAEIKKIRDDYDGKLLQQSIDFDLSGYNYAFPDATPMGTKIAAAKASLNARLAADGAKVITDAAGNKKVVNADGTDYYDANKKAVSYKDYITAALTQDNLLTASKDPKGNPGRKDDPPTKIPGQDGKGDSTFLAAADADIANLEQAMKG